jgi:antitoxin (DNA-binding transcriptional repressor) of toxin-antitoxin stability system
LVDRLQGGESEVILERDGSPVAKIVAQHGAPIRKQRIPGIDKGKYELTDAFFEPLPDEILDAFNAK